MESNLESTKSRFEFKTRHLLIIGILVLVGTIALIIFVARRMSNPKKRQLNILRERLAKGEVTKEEYDKLKKEFK